jgi:glutamate N-acetyltransferase / amino-acid N-acetyltransferase
LMSGELINSPLIKTMVHGADPNVGRILMAVGKSDAAMAPAKTMASVNGFPVVRNGARVEFDDGTVRAALSTTVVDLVVELGVGMASATAYGCDLSRGYVDENAAYYSS